MYILIDQQVCMVVCLDPWTNFYTEPGKNGLNL